MKQWYNSNVGIDVITGFISLIFKEHLFTYVIPERNVHFLIRIRIGNVSSLSSRCIAHQHHHIERFVLITSTLFVDGTRLQDENETNKKTFRFTVGFCCCCWSHSLRCTNGNSKLSSLENNQTDDKKANPITFAPSNKTFSR